MSRAFSVVPSIPVRCRYDEALYCPGTSEARVSDAGKTLLMDMLFAATDGVVRSRRRMHFHAVSTPCVDELTISRERVIEPLCFEQTVSQSCCIRGRSTTCPTNSSRCFGLINGGRQTRRGAGTMMIALLLGSQLGVQERHCVCQCGRSAEVLHGATLFEHSCIRYSSRRLHAVACFERESD
jgi:hypothetical protein